MHPSNFPRGLASPTDLERVISKVTAIYEDELGDDLGAWGAVTMVLLTIICDMAEADIHQVADALKRGEKGMMQ
jgi:hypothetical protein